MAWRTDSVSAFDSLLQTISGVMILLTDVVKEDRPNNFLYNETAESKRFGKLFCTIRQRSN